MKRILTARYRWRDTKTYGPAPWFHFAVRPAGTSWVRIEGSLLGRCFMITWGDWE